MTGPAPTRRWRHRRVNDDWTSAYAAVAAPPREFLAALAERAGIHRYVTTPDQVWATSTLLGISVDAPGPRVIRLPQGHAGDALRDPLSGETFPVDWQKCATVDFAEGATRVFFLLDKE